MTSEPVVAYPLRDVLARIEADMAALRRDIQAIQLTLAKGSGATAAEAARSAAGRARVATWAAAVAAVGGPLSAVLIAVMGGH